MKPDERALLLKLLELHSWEAHARRGDLPFADAVGAELGIHWKRVEYLLEKWTGRGWWDSGVSARSGWFTPEGIEALRAILPAPSP